MSGRAGLAWQTSLADLSLILFMVTAAAVSQQPGNMPQPGMRIAAPPSSPSPQSEPLSLYVAAPGAPSLAQWLRDQAADPRQQLTITARYGPGGQAQALADAARLAAQAGALGRAARVVVEPGEGPARVALAYDPPGETGMARDLHGSGASSTDPKAAP